VCADRAPGHDVWLNEKIAGKFSWRDTPRDWPHYLSLCLCVFVCLYVSLCLCSSSELCSACGQCLMCCELLCVCVCLCVQRCQVTWRRPRNSSRGFNRKINVRISYLLIYLLCFCWLPVIDSWYKTAHCHGDIVCGLTSLTNSTLHYVLHSQHSLKFVGWPKYLESLQGPPWCQMYSHITRSRYDCWKRKV